MKHISLKLIRINQTWYFILLFLAFYKYQLSLNMNNFNNDANLVENINEDLKICR